MERKNMWGDLSNLDIIRSPAIILREQAGLVQEMTGDILRGEVVQSSHGGDFFTSLYIVAPSIQRYRIKILDVVYNAELYPLHIRAALVDAEFDVGDQEQFEGVLEAILSSDKVRHTISALMSESRSESEPIV